MIGILVVRHPQELPRHLHQAAIGRVAPAMVRTAKDRGVPCIIAADLHPPVPTGVQEHMQLALPVTGEDHRLIAHLGDEVVIRVGDLAFVANEEPGAGEDLCQFLPVDLVTDEDLTADFPALQIDQALC